MDDVQLVIIDANFPTSLKQAMKLANTCNIHKSLATQIKYWMGAENSQDSPSREWVAPTQDIERLEDELEVEKCDSAELERWLN